MLERCTLNQRDDVREGENRKNSLTEKLGGRVVVVGGVVGFVFIFLLKRYLGPVSFHTNARS